MKKFIRLDPPPAGFVCRPLDGAARGRAESLAPLAHQLAWKFARYAARDVPAEELVAEALLALTNAAGQFDESRGVPFAAFAALAIRRRLIYFVITWRRGRWLRSLPDRLPDAEWDVADPGAGAAAREMCERVRRILPARWYVALRLYHAEGHTMEEIGARFGISRERVRQLVRKATLLAREHFPEWTAN
jgi:RNA polymerase sigma factor (sigma-70 family)